MRVSVQSDAYAGACENFVKGEVEDYGILITPAIPFAPRFSSQPGALTDLEDRLSLRAWPNPARSSLSIELRGAASELQLVSATGVTVLRLPAKPEFFTESVSLEGIAPGLYLLVAQGADGATRSLRIVVQ